MDGFSRPSKGSSGLDSHPDHINCMCLLPRKELLGLKAEVTGQSKRCQLAEERETTATARARVAEERAAVLTMELAKSRAEVRVVQIPDPHLQMPWA